MLIDSVIDGPVATLRLNRPDRLNALSEEMKDSLGDILLTLGRDESVPLRWELTSTTTICAAGRASIYPTGDP